MFLSYNVMWFWSNVRKIDIVRKKYYVFGTPYYFFYYICVKLSGAMYFSTNRAIELKQ